MLDRLQRSALGSQPMNETEIAMSVLAVLFVGSHLLYGYWLKRGWNRLKAKWRSIFQRNEA